ncbi:hypothetical protein QBC39DRAFT_336905 [Podospora conica]|nr:hypothetical protein QBC39DRAFT_336905 [Schizothecium conicum]
MATSMMATPWLPPPHHLPFLLHAAVELPAGLKFITSPLAQVPARSSSPEVALIVRSYGALLLTTVALSLHFCQRPVYDDTSAVFSLAMATYHISPVCRAYSRIRHGIGMEGPQRGALGGPVFHFVVHGACLVGLVVGWMKS